MSCLMLSSISSRLPPPSEQSRPLRGGFRISEILLLGELVDDTVSPFAALCGAIEPVADGNQVALG
jgi:hypothetical protein